MKKKTARPRIATLTDIEFVSELPPGTDRHRRDWGAILQTLQKSPGKWARILVAASNKTAQGLRQQAKKKLEGVELAVRDCEVYARAVK
jgi:hypothetical protein